MIKKLEDIGVNMELYDINMCVKAIEVGARYVNATLIYTEESRREDEGIPADKRTFRILQEVGNTIHPSVQLEVDVPSNHADTKLPILDLKVWIGEVEVDDERQLKILHEHYSKPMANKLVVHKEAAMSMRDKRNILTQMCLRVLLNNSECLMWERKKEKVELFMKRMQASGYDERLRYEVLKSAIEAFDKICQSSERPKYRGKEWNTPKLRRERQERRRNWFRRGGFESVMFVPATPQSELRKRIMEEVGRSEVKIKVVERPGKKFKQMLQKNDPFKQKECGDESCFVCNTTKEGSCRKPGVTYMMNCKGTCDRESVYYGETHANAYTRGKEHVSEYRRKQKNSVLWKHCVKQHNGEEQEFEMKVVDFARGDPTKRQILEAVRINEMHIEKRMNDKKEWIVGKLPSVSVTEY